MHIHNIYSDLLLSTTYFLNNKVLRYSSTNIKMFEYNIGNASFQLKYDTQYELPAAIVKMENPRKYLGISHPWAHQHNVFGNIHRTDVLYNETKDEAIELQEEMYEIPISITINCESQIQALDIQHTFQQYTPIGAYLNYYEFVSFIELESSIFNKWMFDLNNDKIINLFYKQNEYTDESNYCFALKFAPLMRVNDVSISLGQSTDPSYSVNITLEVVTSIPSYIIYPFLDIQSNVEIPTVRVERKNRMVPTKEVSTVRVCPQQVNGDKLDPVYIQVVESDDDYLGFEQEFEFNDDGVLKSGMLTGNITEEKKIFDVQAIIRGSPVVAKVTVIKNLETGVLTGIIQGDTISGRLKKIEYVGASTMKAFFEGSLDASIIEDAIVFDYAVISKIRDVKNLKITFPNNPEYTVYCLENVNPKEVFSAVQDMNQYTSLISFADSNIKGFIKKGVLTELDPPLEINNNGGFILDDTVGDINPSTGTITLTETVGTAIKAFGQHFIDLSHTTGEITIDDIDGTYDINNGEIIIDDKTGIVDLNTGDLIFDGDHGNIDWETGIVTMNRIDQLLFDFVFQHSTYGGKYIKKIITHFTDIKQPITTSLDSYQGYDYNFVLTTIENRHISSTKQYEFDIDIDSFIEYTDIGKWKMTISGENFIADSTMTDVELISATDHKLVFRCPELVYLKYISSVNVVNPLILSFTTIT
jgi:hypothetical protein